jgi:signal transduction histidine kinase
MQAGRLRYLGEPGAKCGCADRPDERDRRMDRGFAPNSAAERQWWDASRRSRQTAHRVFAWLFVVAVVAQTILLAAASERRPAGWFLTALPLLLALLAGWEWHEARWIEGRIAVTSAPGSARVRLTAALEAGAPLAGIALLASVFGWRVALGGPPLIAAVLIPLVSVLRLDYRICAGQGAVAAGGYLVLVLLARKSGETAMAGELLRLHFGKAMLLLLGGVIAGYVAEQNRRRLIEVIREATGRATAQEKLAVRTRDYQQAEERIGRKDEFISILSHDLRTPLDGVAGLAQLMARRPDQFNAEEIRKYAVAIQETARELRELLDNIVAWAELRTGTRAGALEPVPLAELARPVARLFEPALSARRLRCELNVPSNATVIGDPRGLAAVIRNLLSNAIKFTPAEGSIEVRVEDAGVGAGAMLALVVADTGVGPEAMRAGGEAGAAAGRQGIGLALVRQLLERLNGRLELRPRAGGGTEAWVWLVRGDRAAGSADDAVMAAKGGGSRAAGVE